ncbi:LuxR family transcriptional regulator [Sphingomonas canadensis]|uniref:LuxR family transcriptional regulator n=1 Tax=Sphingomonas canadensis TaxID=1219257 RepID=A0ABW3H605_9SPHN|nr:LuxR family transcriptional regulator [Sphingomonas canadensis]MCW3836647.1 LuxR family transcriptional regulator [Sphingomonas canadensis]
MSQLEDVNSFIGKVRAISTADDLRLLMESITREMGFANYSLFQHVHSWDWNSQSALAISNYPTGWIEYFFSKQFNRFDPVLRAAQRTALGFRWDEIPRMLPLSPKQLRVLEAGRRSGMANGFTVPANIPGEATGSCSFVVPGNVALPERNLSMAHLIGGFGYEAARQLWTRQVGIVRRAGPARLTPRQHDCLVLVAQGKTDWEIAQVLGLKESTVNGYIDDAKAALGVTRRSQLVTRALYEGHICLSEALQ